MVVLRRFRLLSEGHELEEQAGTWMVWGSNGHRDLSDELVTLRGVHFHFAQSAHVPLALDTLFGFQTCTRRWS